MLESSEILKNALKMTGSPVALKFAATKDDIPAGVEEIEKTVRHCSMVNLARKEGRIFFATSPKHECNGGAWALGLREKTHTLITGEFYFKLGKFNSAPACKRTMEAIPHLQSGETYATVYAPLEKVPFTPHIIFIVANPWSMLKLAQSSSSDLVEESMQSFRESSLFAPMQRLRHILPEDLISHWGATVRENFRGSQTKRW